VITPRDRTLGWVSLSCQEGECWRCKPRLQPGAPADGIAPNCSHSCHEASEEEQGSLVIL